MTPSEHRARIAEAIGRADRALERIIRTQDQLRRWDARLARTLGQADRLDGPATSLGDELADMVVADIRGRGAGLIRATANLAGTALALSRTTADSGMRIKRAMEAAADPDVRGVLAWWHRRQLDKAAAQLEELAGKVDVALANVVAGYEAIPESWR